MTRQLPSRPNLEQLRKQAKSVLKGHHAATPETLGRIREHHPHCDTPPKPLSPAPRSRSLMRNSSSQPNTALRPGPA
jgi:hypothetical protein